MINSRLLGNARGGGVSRHAWKCHSVLAPHANKLRPQALECGSNKACFIAPANRKVFTFCFGSELARQRAAEASSAMQLGEFHVGPIDAVDGLLQFRIKSLHSLILNTCLPATFSLFVLGLRSVVFIAFAALRISCVHVCAPAFIFE
jgi:hypothetical protein